MRTVRPFLLIAAATLVVGALFAHPAHAAATPTVTTPILTNGRLKITVGTEKVTLRPFPNYGGAVWAKRVTFGSKRSIYLFVPKAAGVTSSPLKYYETYSKTWHTLTPFYGAHDEGYNVSVVVQPLTKKVYLAFGTKTSGASARIIEMTKNGHAQVNNPTVADTADKGVVLVKFLKLYTDEYGLVTMVANNAATLKVWRYSASTYRFDEDVNFDTSAIETDGNRLRLLSGFAPAE